MKTKHLLAALAVFALIAGFAVRSARQIAWGKTELGALAAQRDEMRQEAIALEVRLQSTSTALAGSRDESPARVEPAGGTAREFVTPRGTQTNPENGGRRLNPMTLIANDPRKMAEHLKNVRASVELGYGPLFRAIGASPEQIEKLKDVEVALEQTRMDIQAAVDLHQLDPNSAAGKRLWDDYNQARVAKRAEALGDVNHRLVDYDRSESVREIARMLAVTGVVTGERATADQVYRAGNILAANCKRWSTDSYPGWTDEATIDWDVAKEQLKSVLSPAQIDILRLQIESSKIKAKLNDRTRLLTAEFKKQQAKQ